MTIEPMALSALLSSVISYVAWRWHRPSAHCVPGPLRLADGYLARRAAATRQRQHHKMVLAAIAALPPGALLVDQRREGTLRIKLAPLPTDTVGGTSLVTRSFHRPKPSADLVPARTKPSALQPAVTYGGEGQQDVG
jgi:hypothetical protein